MTSFFLLALVLSSFSASAHFNGYKLRDWPGESILTSLSGRVCGRGVPDAADQPLNQHTMVPSSSRTFYE